MIYVNIYGRNKIKTSVKTMGDNFVFKLISFLVVQSPQ